MWLVTEHGDNASIDVIRTGAVLSNSATFTSYNLPVNGYSRPIQRSTLTRTDFIGMTFMRSGTDNATDYVSMYVTGRGCSDGSGTMQTPALVAAGAGQANYSDFASSHRAGDLSGINVDPAKGSFWAASAYATTTASGSQASGNCATLARAEDHAF
jgi:hypothetical protein